MDSPTKLVIIHWMDSKGITSEWEFLDDLKAYVPAECTSVGYLLEDAPEYKTIVQSLGGSQVMGRLSIPAACIQEIKEVHSV